MTSLSKKFIKKKLIKKGSVYYVTNEEKTKIATSLMALSSTAISRWKWSLSSWTWKLWYFKWHFPRISTSFCYEVSSSIDVLQTTEIIHRKLALLWTHRKSQLHFPNTTRQSFRLAMDQTTEKRIVHGF